MKLKLINLFLILVAITVANNLMAMEKGHLRTKQAETRPSQNQEIDYNKDFDVDLTHGFLRNATGSDLWECLRELNDVNFKQLTDELTDKELLALDNKLPEIQRKIFHQRIDKLKQAEEKAADSSDSQLEDFLNSQPKNNGKKINNSKTILTMFGIGLVSIVPIAYLIYKLIAKPKNNNN